MPLEMLYIEDPDCLQFATECLEQTPLPDGRVAVRLARSYFYPTGGGQDHDLGSLNSLPVLDVYRDEAGQILHLLPEVLPEPKTVNAQIDPARRRANMQAHTAQHLLTGCFVQLFGYETVSAGVSATATSTIDLPVDAVTPEQIATAEQLANRMIHENHPVTSYFASPAELAQLPLRKPPKVSEDIRIVEIDGFDYSPCGGTHVRRTGEIGVLKVLRTERINQKTRVHFVSGMLALGHFSDYQTILQDLARGYSVAVEDLPGHLARQSEHLKATQRELETLQRSQLELEAQLLAAGAGQLRSESPAPQSERQPSSNIRVVTKAYPDRSAGELRSLGMALQQAPGLVAALAASDGTKLSLVVACHPESGIAARGLLAALLAPYQGRGGGDAGLAQGGSRGSLADAEALLAAVPAELARMVSTQR